MTKHVQKGFSILEFVISLMISTMLMTAALTIYQQVSSSSKKIQNITSKDISLMILEKRLTDDLLGLSPLWFNKENITNTEQAKNNSKEQSSAKEQTKDPNTEKNNFFYAQTQNNQIDFITFISTSTLHSFTSPRLYIARIVYMLQPDQDKPGFFILQRKEEKQISNEINLQKIKDGSFYTLIKNIKNCSLEYGFIDISPEKRSQASQDDWKMKWVQQWGKEQEQKKTSESEKEEYVPKLPDVVKIKITIQEFEGAPTTEHEIYCIVPPSKESNIDSITEKRKQKEASSQQANLANANTIMNKVQASKAAATKSNNPLTAKR